MTDAREIIQSCRAENVFYPFNTVAQYELAKHLSTPILMSKQRVNRIGMRASDTYLRDNIGFHS